MCTLFQQPSPSGLSSLSILELTEADLSESLRHQSGDVFHAFKKFRDGQAESTLKGNNKDFLQFMCQFYGLSDEELKAELARHLVNLVC
jgi:hypothetical protein